MRRYLITLGVVALSARPAGAQEPTPSWAFTAAAYTYIVPDDSNYVQPTMTADHRRWHFEARYNYEALETGSAWLGANFSGGDSVSWQLTPIIGGIFGDVSGVAPGYKGSLGWRKLELYSEGEYVFDSDGVSANFFYNWSELTYAPIERFWFGVVTQRTRVYHTERDIQRGLLAGVSFRNIDVVGHLFNPDDSDPTVVVAVRVSF